MSRALELSLRDAASSTFEEVVFLLVAPLPAREGEHGETADAAVSIAFRGPLTGSLRVTVSGGVLPTIAANMLGEDATPARQVQLDALGEIANMICGTLLPGLASGAEFRQQPPRVLATGADAEPALEPAAVARFALLRGSASVQLFLDEAA